MFLDAGGWGWGEGGRVGNSTNSRKKDKAQRSTGLGRRPREVIGNGNQMTYSTKISKQKKDKAEGSTRPIEESNDIQH